MNPEANGSQMTDWEAQLVDYAMGTLPATSTADFERQLEECRGRVELARQYTDMVGILGQAVLPAAPPAGHRERFLARLEASPQDVREKSGIGVVGVGPARSAGAYEQSGKSNHSAYGAVDSSAKITSISDRRENRTRQAFWPAFAAVAAAFAFLLGGWGWANQSQLNAARSDEMAIQRQLDAATTDQARLQDQVNALQTSLIVPAGYVPFPVKSTGVMTNAWAVCLVNRAGGDMLLMANGLANLPADKVYELWWLPAQSGAAPLRGGEFTADKAGLARQTVKIPAPLNTFNGVAVTVEQAPGVEKAAGPVVLTGKYKFP